MKKIILILLLVTACVKAEGQVIATEDSLKAAFIFHFISFTEWEDNSPEYNVCVPDDEQLNQALQSSLKGKVVNNRKIVVARHASVCHVLISEEPPADENALTIGPLDKGALLEFRRVNNKLKFAANFEKIKESHLKISSQLLKLAILDGAP